MKKKKRIIIPIENTSGVRFHYINDEYMRWDLKDDSTGERVRLVWQIDDLMVIRDAINAYLDNQEARKLQKTFDLEVVHKPPMREIEEMERRLAQKGKR